MAELPHTVPAPIVIAPLEEFQETTITNHLPASLNNHHPPRNLSVLQDNNDIRYQVQKIVLQ